MDVIKKNFKNITCYKDLGMRIIDHDIVDADSCAMGRDLAYAQFLKILADKDSKFVENLLFDRGYWSSYVYAQCWRDKHSKRDMARHVNLVEQTFSGLLNDIKIIYLNVDDEDLKRIESMDRDKDIWEKTRTDYRYQLELYEELLGFNVSVARKFPIKAFQPEEKLIKDISEVLMA